MTVKFGQLRLWQNHGVLKAIVEGSIVIVRRRRVVFIIECLFVCDYDGWLHGREIDTRNVLWGRMDLFVNDGGGFGGYLADDGDGFGRGIAWIQWNFRRQRLLWIECELVIRFR